MGYFIVFILVLAVCWLVGWWLIETDYRRKVWARESIQRDYLETKKAMNEVAGKSYRNMVL